MMWISKNMVPLALTISGTTELPEDLLIQAHERGCRYREFYPLTKWHYGKRSVHLVEVTGLTEAEKAQYLLDLTHN